MAASGSAATAGGERKNMSCFTYFLSEFKQDAVINEHDEKRFEERWDKVMKFITLPAKTEPLFAHGFFQCADSFAFVMGVLPIRILVAVLCVLWRTARCVLAGFRRNPSQPLLVRSGEAQDLVKGFLLVLCILVMHVHVDTPVIYHHIRTQSSIKLYLLYNILEIGDRLMSSFGQDALEALSLSVSEPKPASRRRHAFATALLLSVICTGAVYLHSLILLIQTHALSVAMNADYKGLLTILISNNFVELKGSVFKKFDQVSLLQIATQDAKERFNICIILVLVGVQTYREFNFNEALMYDFMFDCMFVLGVEALVDWIKHAFIARFNGISEACYGDYTVLLASDFVCCKRSYGHQDHSEVIARRMAFIPLPLCVVVARILSQTVSLHNTASWVLVALTFLSLTSFKLLNGIVLLLRSTLVLSRVQAKDASVSSSSNGVPQGYTESLVRCSTPRKEEGVPLRTSSLSEPLLATPIKRLAKERKRVRLNSGAMVQEFESFELEKYDGEITAERGDVTVSLDDLRRECGGSMNSASLESVSGAGNLYDRGSLDMQGNLFTNSNVNLANAGLNQGPSSPQSGEIVEDIGPDSEAAPALTRDSVSDYSSNGNLDDSQSSCITVKQVENTDSLESSQILASQVEDSSFNSASVSMVCVDESASDALKDLEDKLKAGKDAVKVCTDIPVLGNVVEKVNNSLLLIENKLAGSTNDLSKCIIEGTCLKNSSLKCSEQDASDSDKENSLSDKDISADSILNLPYRATSAPDVRHPEILAK